MSIAKFYTFSSRLSSSTVQAHAINLNDKEDNTESIAQCKDYITMFFEVIFAY